MNTIKEIVEQLPYIMTFFVEGYIFIMMYKYIVVKKSDTDTKNLFLKCVISSFIIKSMVDIALNRLGISIQSNAKYIILLCGISLLLGYICGKLATAKWFQEILFTVGIHRTPNDRVWDDVLLNGQQCWICMQSPKNADLQYLGLYQYCEEFEREPIISLSHYQILDMQGNVVDDQSQSGNIIMLNTKGFEKIEILYGEKTDAISKIKSKLILQKKLTEVKQTTQK